MTLTPNRRSAPVTAGSLTGATKTGTSTGRVIAVLRIAFGLTFF